MCVAGLSACGAGGVATGIPTMPSDLVLRVSNSPIDLNGVAARFSADIAYDSHTQTVFDVFLPTTNELTGLIIFVHGGGFTSGDKSAAYSGVLIDDIQQAIAQGVAYASINYRLLNSADEEGVIKPLSDIRRALQFMRRHSEPLNIDPARVAMYGNSAGGGASLWLAFHDEMAVLNSVDPVLRQSTRLAAVGAMETQASYDIFRWESDVFSDFGITVESLFDQDADSGLPRLLLSFYGLSSEAQLSSLAVEGYRADVDLLRLLSVDDAPMWLRNAEQEATLPTSVAHLFEHPFHARELKEQADNIGLANTSYIPQIGVNDPSGEGHMSFLLRHVQ